MKTFAEASNLRSPTRQQYTRGFSEGLRKAITEFISRINSVKLLNPDTVVAAKAERAQTEGRKL